MHFVESDFMVFDFIVKLRLTDTLLISTVREKRSLSKWMEVCMIKRSKKITMKCVILSCGRKDFEFYAYGMKM